MRLGKLYTRIHKVGELTFYHYTGELTDTWGWPRLHLVYKGCRYGVVRWSWNSSDPAKHGGCLFLFPHMTAALPGKWFRSWKTMLKKARACGAIT